VDRVREEGSPGQITSGRERTQGANSWDSIQTVLLVCDLTAHRVDGGLERILIAGSQQSEVSKGRVGEGRLESRGDSDEGRAAGDDVVHDREILDAPGIKGGAYANGVMVVRGIRSLTGAGGGRLADGRLPYEDLSEALAHPLGEQRLADAKGRPEGMLSSQRGTPGHGYENGRGGKSLLEESMRPEALPDPGCRVLDDVPPAHDPIGLDGQHDSV